MNHLKIVAYPRPEQNACPPFVAVSLGQDGTVSAFWYPRTVEDLEGLLGTLLQSVAGVEEVLKALDAQAPKPEAEPEEEREGDLAASFQPDTFEEAEGIR